jgi:hypothetical protein
MQLKHAPTEAALTDVEYEPATQDKRAVETEAPNVVEYRPATQFRHDAIDVAAF